MKKYILNGDPKEVAKVIQENRIRVERGLIKFEPVQPETALDSDSIRTLIESHDIAEKECQRMAVSQHELAGLADELKMIIVDNGLAIPDGLAERLVPFGITVPKIAETVPSSEETPEIEGESVPKIAETVNPAEMDDKYVQVDDLQEIDLDADDKSLETDDTKDVPATDSKEAAPAKKSTKRSKKSE